MHKIKYKVLMDLVKDLPYETEFVTLFIDIDSIIKKFYNPKFVDTFKAFNTYEKLIFSSEIINIAAHYRHFFWSRFGIPCDIYMLYNDKSCDLVRQYNSDFNDRKYNDDNHFKHSHFKILYNTFQKNFELITMLKDYLPSIYFINGMGLAETFMLPQLILNRPEIAKNNLNLIITSDGLMNQYINTSETCILRLNYDGSYIINEKNLMGEVSKDVNTDLTPFYINHYYALAGLKNSSIHNVNKLGPKKTLSFLYNVSKLGNFTFDSKISLKKFISIIRENELLSEDDISLFKSNYKSINAKKLCTNISNNDTFSILSQMGNKLDNDSLMRINESYYENNPIQLIELCEGVDFNGSRSFQF